MAAITDYSTLKAAISDWLDRSDLDDYVDQFIDFAEQKFWRGDADLPPLRIRAMETALSVTIASGVAAVPSDYLELKHAYVDGTPTQWLDIVSPQALYAKYPTRSSEGRPVIIARDAGNFIFGPYPDSTYTIAGIYYATLTALSDSNTTNWLITNAPNAYLFGALVEAAAFVGEDGRLPLWQQKHRAAIVALNEQDDRERWPRGMSLRMTPG